MDFVPEESAIKTDLIEVSPLVDFVLVDNTVVVQFRRIGLTCLTEEHENIKYLFYLT